MKSPKKRVISRTKYLQALGLFTLANKRCLESRAAELEMIKLLGYEDHDHGGFLSEQIFQERPQFDHALTKDGIVVRKL